MAEDFILLPEQPNICSAGRQNRGLVCREARNVPELFCSEWNAHNVKPEHVGYYEVRNTNPRVDRRFSSYLSGTPFRYWDGTHWLPSMGDSRPSIFGQYVDHQWRGLRQEYKTPEELQRALDNYYNDLTKKGNRDVADRQSAEEV